MSEFSEGYYLRTGSREEASALLQKAGVPGYVFPARDGWTTFAADTSPLFKFSEKLKEANEGILLHLVNAEDHGWGFDVCMGGELVCSYFCGYNEEMDAEEIYLFERSKTEDGFGRLMQAENGRFSILGRYFEKEADAQEIADVSKFAEDMELYFSDWISYQYAQAMNGNKYGEYDKLELIKVDPGSKEG